MVRGNERLAEGDVLAVLSGLRGESLMWTDLDRWRRRLLASPWVRDAVLRRSLPSTVEVVVWERQPIGIGRINGEMYLVDEAGVIVDEYGPQYADMDLPIIDGLTRSADQDGAGTDEARAGLAARVITALRAKPAVARMLSQVDVTDVRNAAVILNGDSAVIQLGDDQFLPRLQGTSSWRRHCARASRISTTSTSGSTAASTCDRHTRLKRRRRRPANARRRNVNSGPEAAWRAKSGIW